MRLAQLQRPLQAVAAAAGGYRPVPTTFSLPIRPAIRSTPAQTQSAEGSAVVQGRRYASVKSQGAYTIPNKKTLPKKLGAKRSGDQYVIPGNIIYKQRGTIWHEGENAIRGRDHTIHAAVAGYVKYYRDPQKHPHRQYIGVAFNRDDTLPYPRDQPRKRKLGMVAVKRKTHEKSDNITASGIPKRVVRKGGMFDIEAMQDQLWSRERARVLAEARKEGARTGTAGTAAAAAAAAGAPAAAAAAAELAASAGETELSPVTGADSGSSKPGKKARRTRAEQKRFIHPLVFIQKRWLERRRTRTLHLNPSNYSYTESNAAIGRLSSRTMYTPPWKLGGRKARFRAKRQRREKRIEQLKADRELVKAEKEKERIAEEKKREAKLAKQRAKGLGNAAVLETASKEMAEGPKVEA